MHNVKGERQLSSRDLDATRTSNSTAICSARGVDLLARVSKTAQSPDWNDRESNIGVWFRSHCSAKYLVEAGP